MRSTCVDRTRQPLHQLPSRSLRLTRPSPPFKGKRWRRKKPLPSQGRKGLPSVVPPCLAHDAGHSTGRTMHPLSAVTGSPEPACCPRMGHQPVDSPATFGGARIVGGSHPVTPILWRRPSTYSSGSWSLQYGFLLRQHYSSGQRGCQIRSGHRACRSVLGL